VAAKTKWCCCGFFDSMLCMGEAGTDTAWEDGGDGDTLGWGGYSVKLPTS
jgi:hypothetical protein